MGSSTVEEHIYECRLCMGLIVGFALEVSGAPETYEETMEIVAEHAEFCYVAEIDRPRKVLGLNP